MPTPWPRSILHVDMDAFFAAIEQRDNPELRGKPILVGGAGPRGVVSTASYEARPYGCRSAQPMAVARRLCPQAIVVKPNFPSYRAASDEMFAILESFSPLVQPISVDEAFLDVGGTERLFGDAISIAKMIRQRIRAQLRVTASVGVAHNKFLAKLASDLDKPDGLTVIGPDDVSRVLPPLPIGKIWGIGPKTAAKMASMGLSTIGDILRLSSQDLAMRFGDEEGGRYGQLARGIDDRPVTPDRLAKSIGHETTFGQDLIEPEQLRGVLLEQSEAVAARLRRKERRARRITVKIRDGQFNTVTRSRTLPVPTDATADIWNVARELFDAWALQSFRPVRLIGVSTSDFAAPGAPAIEQLPLFGNEQRERRRDLDRALDKINDRYGKSTVSRGRIDRDGKLPKPADEEDIGGDIDFHGD